MRLVLCIVFISLQSFAQQSKGNESWWTENYTSTTTISINGNYDSRFGNESESRIQKGLAFEVTTLHGIFLFDYLSVSAGLGVDWNIDKTFWSIPVIGDFRLYFYEYGYDSPFAFLQMGKNLKIGEVFTEGRSVKIGLGVTWTNNQETQYVFEFFKKFKEAVFIDEEQNYGVKGFGVSLGIKF